MTIESQTLLDHPTESSDWLSIDRLPLAYIVLDAEGRVRNGIERRRNCLVTPEQKHSVKLASIWLFRCR